jgi:membrane fusion protein (multidrug efflux system)
MTAHAHVTSEVSEHIAATVADPTIAARKKRLVTIGSIVLGVIALAVGIRYLVWASGHEETDDAYLEAHVHPISARVTDTVQQVLVDDNYQVKQDQVLVVLDPNDYQVRLDQARAALDTALHQSEAASATIGTTAQSATAETTQANAAISQAMASIEAAKAAVLAAKAGIPRAEAQLDQAKAMVKREEDDLHRYQDLFDKQQVSRQTVDHAHASYLIAAAGRAAAEEQVRQAEAQFVAATQDVAKAQSLLSHSEGSLQAARAAHMETRVREGDFASSEAAISKAKAAVAQAQLELSYTVIKAPVAGKIGKKSVEAGQRLQVGQPLMAVVENRPWVVANFKETQLGKMRPGQRVEVEIDTFSHHKFSGHVESLAPGSGNEFALLPPDNATGNFTKIVQRIPVKIILDEPSVRGYEDLLAPGMSCVVTVTTR